MNKKELTGKGFEFVDSGHSYYLDGVRMTGVTTVLGVLAKPQLIPWAARMTADHIRENCRNRTLDDDGRLFVDKETYIVHEKDLEEAVKAHQKKKEAGAESGTDLHALAELYIKGCIDNNNGKARDIECNDRFLQRFIDWSTDNNVRFFESEKKMYSKEWFVAGTCDFTCEINGKRYVGDLKTYKKIWDRVPHIQCSAYMKMLIEMGEEKYDGTVIININKETAELTEQYSYAFEQDIKSFEAALTLYRALN